MKQLQYPPALYPFPPRWTTIDGARIHYIDEGQGEILLFCHPPISSSFMYRHLIRRLSKRFRCIAIDFPGFGLSEERADTDFSIAGWAKVLDQFIQNLNLSPFYLVMQEVGGHAAMQVLLERPHLLKGVLLTDTIIFPCTEYPRIARMLGFVNGPFFNFLNSNFNLLIRAMTNFGFQRRKLSREEKRMYRALFPTKLKRRRMTRMLYEVAKQTELLQRIHRAFSNTFREIPALIIYGTQDPLARMGIPGRSRTLLTNAELYWIEGEGHFPHEGAPDEMAEIIEGWMGKRHTADDRQELTPPETSSPDSKPRSGRRGV